MHVCALCGNASAEAGFCTADGAALAWTTDPLLGTEVLRYRLARLIGEGGMGKVYLGVQPQIGSRVAVKILSAHCASNPDLLERFFAEGRAVNLIRHEHIVSVLDLALLPDGRPLIVMEYIDGVTLRQLVRDGGAPLAAIARIGCEVLSALHAAHAIGIIHRDIKPDNVLLTAKGHAKVLDFGIAKLAPGLADEASSPRTRTGALLGTPSYMAPEQISGEPTIDARTDVYATGVMLFEAVTGRLPFAGVTVFDSLRAHVDDPPPSPRALRPDLSPAFEAVILTALAKDPARRFQSAADMEAALEQAAVAVALPDAARAPVRSSMPILAPAPPARRTWAVVAGCVVLGAAVGAIGYVALHASEPREPPDDAAIAALPPSPSPSPSPPPSPSPSVADAAIISPSATLDAAVDVAVAPPDAASAQAPPPKPKPKPVAGAAMDPAWPTRDRPKQVDGAFDAHRFQYRLFSRTARKLAREVMPDALLVELDLAGLFETGRVDLDLAGDRTQYVFRSQAETDAHRACVVIVAVHTSGAQVFVDPKWPCTQPFAGMPPLDCSIPWLWREAGAQVPHANAIYTAGHWRFIAPDVDRTFATTCRGARDD